MAENMLDRIVRNIGSELGLKSLQDQLDENFDNGIEVAAAPLAPRGFQLGGRKYVKKIGNRVVSDASPRDIIRNEMGFYPVQSIVRHSAEEPYVLKNAKTGEEFTSVSPISSDNYDFAYKKNGELKKNWIVKDTRSDRRKAFENTFNDVRNARERQESFLRDDPFYERLSRIELGQSKNIKDDIKNYGKATLPVNQTFTVHDWNDYVDAKRRSKEQGEELAREFARKGSNTIEKNKYINISGGKPEIWGLQYPNVDIPQNVRFSSKGDARKFIDERNELGYEGNSPVPVLVHKGSKPTKALGGQNSKYLGYSLNDNEVQSISELEESARPISYDKFGKPYVRGYTWTQTNNIPKILDENSGYLSIVGADAANYHPDINGHWTSYGWGNPMDKNYENNIRPGEVEDINRYIVKGPNGKKIEYGDFWDADDFISRQLSNGGKRTDWSIEKKKVGEKNFDEQLIETRWPLKFYQKSNSWHQPNAERVVVMGSKPSSKDVHIPVMGEKDYFGNINDALESYYSAGLIDFIDYKNMKSKMETEGRKGTKFALNRLNELGLGSFNRPTRTNVYKIATPSSMMNVHDQNEMPWDWSMHDRKNGGNTLPGFHPNKKWSGMDTEKFISLGKKANPEAFKQAEMDANRLGYAGGKKDAHIAIQLSKDPAVKSAIISRNIRKDEWNKLNKLQASAVGDYLSGNDYTSPYNLAMVGAESVEKAPMQGEGSMARGMFFDPNAFTDYQKKALLNAVWDNWDRGQLITKPYDVEYHATIPNEYKPLLKAKNFEENNRDGDFRASDVFGQGSFKDYFINNGVDINLYDKFRNFNRDNKMDMPKTFDLLKGQFSHDGKNYYKQRNEVGARAYKRRSYYPEDAELTDEQLKERGDKFMNDLMRTNELEVENYKKRNNLSDEEFKKEMDKRWQNIVEYKKLKKRLGHHIGKTLISQRNSRREIGKKYDYYRLLKNYPEYIEWINGFEDPIKDVYSIGEALRNGKYWNDANGGEYGPFKKGWHSQWSKFPNSY